MRFLKVSNYILTRAVVIIMVLLLLLSGYFLWSNQRVYMDAEGVYDSLLQLKPKITDEKTRPDLKALKNINPDVIGWITVDGTKIDYPVVQGKNNLYYMNRDFYGKPSLAGSIFLDTRNSKDFSDAYSLLYGHHMDNHLMFGDLDLFKKETFFRENSTGQLMTEDKVMDLDVLAVLEISDNTKEIFNPTMWGSDLSDLAAFVSGHALYVREETLKNLKAAPKMIQVISLVTCASGHTGMRTVLLLTAERDTPNPDKPHEGDVPLPTEETSSPAQTGDILFNSPWIWFGLLFIGLTAMTVILILERRDKKKKDKS